MYQALYRKWRPQTFDDVIGQQHITESLKNQVRSQRLSHAYIFIGTRGTGKTSCARILAKAVNCENPVNGNPCLTCASCRAIAEGSVMDIVELDAASNNGVDNVRALREEAVFSPSALKRRVYIIDEVHMLSTSAFNALLKILEEPPEHLIFILATTELQKVPATILSRCQRHSFRRIESSALSDYLMQVAQKEKISLQKSASDLIAGLAEGGVRDALSMLDQCSAYGSIGLDEVYASVGLAGNRRTMDLFDSIIAHDTQSAISLFYTLWSDGKDPASLLRELSSLVRDILMLKLAPKNAAELIYGGYDRQALQAYASRLTASQLSGALETLQTALGNMRERLSPKMTAELCIITLCTEVAGDTLQGVDLRLSRLEEALKNGAFPAVEKQTAEAPRTPQMAEAPLVPEEKIPDVPEKLEAAGIPEESVPEESAPAGEVAEAPLDEALPPVPKEAPPSAPKEPDVPFWQSVGEKVRPLLPRDVFMIMPSVASGFLEEDRLQLEVEPGFYYGRFNRPEVLDAFSRAASEVAGRHVTAHIRERKPVPKEPRSLDELRKFPEVRFK